jgi:hypothetical protein
MLNTKLRLSPRRGLLALVAVGLLVSSQPFSLVASAASGPATRLRPRHAAADQTARHAADAPAGERLDSARDVQLRKLLAEAVAGGSFSLEEIEILNRFAFEGTVSELEADVVISRALYDRFVAKRPLTREQEILLEAYEQATARRERGILDRKQEILDQEALEEARGPRKTAGVPNNDTCAGALPISSTLPACSAVVDDITDATTTGDPGIPSCQASVSRSVWFTFTPASTGYYRVTTCMDQGAATTVDDTVMAIYTSAGGCAGPFTEIPFSALSDPCDDDSCAAEANQAVVSTQLTGGITYYVVVWKFGTTAPTAGNTAVQVCVSAATAPGITANDTCAGAQALTLNVPVTGMNGPGAGNDYELAAMSPCFPAGQTAATASGRDVVYSFTAPTTATYSFRLTGYVPIATAGGLSNPVIYVSATCPAATPGMPVVVNCAAAANISTSSSGTLAEEITCLALTSGQQVFVFVDEATPGSGATFSLLAEMCGAQEAEPNDTPATANPIACGVVGGVNPATDTDFYALGTPATGSRVFAAIDASTSAPSQDLDLRVNTTTDTLEFDDANNDVLLGGAAGNVGGTIATGTALFLQVDRFGTTPTTTGSPYRLYSVVQPPIASATLESEDNGTIATADSAVNNYFSGTLAAPSPSTDVDFYGFQATAGDLVFVSLDGDPLRDNTPLNARIDVLDMAGNILFTANDSGSTSSTTTGAGSLVATTPNSPAEAIVFRVATSGNYYVRVTAGSTSVTTAAGDYLLSISRNCQVGGGGLGGGEGTDTIGIYATATGAFFLRNTNSSGGADLVFTFGAGGANFIPLSGDWDGDGDDTIGIYDTTTGTFFLRNTNSAGGADIVVSFGPVGANFVPITGDWDGDGDETVGVYDTTTGAFFLRNSNTPGAADIILTFGPGGADFVPLTGDWDGDGDDTIGIYSISTGAFFLRNTNSNGGADLIFTFGPGGAGITPLTGDYDGDGDDTVGIYIQSSGSFFLKNTNASGGADLIFGFGPGGAGFVPLIGDWDGM